MRPGLAIGGVVVIGAAIAMWFLMRDDDRASSANTPAERPEGSAVAVRTPPVPLDPTRSPALPTVTATERGSAPAGDPPKEYFLDGKRVRDHRKGEHAPIDIPPNVHPPEGRRIKPQLTGALADQVRRVMTECRQSVPPEAMGASPRLEGQIVIAIKDQQATITKSTIQLRDVVGAALEPTKQCIEQKSLGLAAATEEEDLESYSINLTFAFR